MSEDISQDISIRGEGNIVVGKGDVIINPLPLAETRLRHDLGILMKNVETTWIKGVLEKSVHDAALLELGVELREEAVDNPWRMVMEKPDQSREEILIGRKVKDIFDEANRLLLILGDPGSGKTTTLLQLARDLIAEVDTAFTQPVPVILNLSTWTNKQQPLDEWLVLELSNKYRVPKKDGKKWLQDRRILPLLDGLDEVKVENRVTCVEKINQLVDDYGLQGLVVCSRVKDYTELNVRLAFYRAIYLQPLTFDQVDDYLNQLGDKLVTLRSALQSDETIRSMAQSPLILSIMSLAYQNTPPESLSELSSDMGKARIKNLFDTYIARMFNRKASQQEYHTEIIKQRLSWLARNMQRHNQEVFFIENLQPGWIWMHFWRWIYFIGSRMTIIALLLLALSGWDYVEHGDWENTLINGVIMWSSIGLTLGIIDGLRSEWLRKQKMRISFNTFQWSATNIILVGSILGLVYGLIVGLSILEGVFLGSTLGILFGLRGSRQSMDRDIQTVEALRWSWRMATLGLLIGGLLGLVGGLIAIRNLNDPGTITAGIMIGLIGAIINGLHYEIIETKSIPNQGIQLSLRNAIYSGLIFGLIFGLVGGFVDGMIFGLPWWLKFALQVGSMVGIISFLWYGGFDVIQHYTLRLILIIQGHTPRNYARFLDYAVDMIFLQKVGGGYRFIHRMLLEHFAEMGDVEQEQNAR